MSRVVFITGTDTDVGKTVLTASIVFHLERRGKRVVALKPFASGSREDAHILRYFQGGRLSLADINPFYYKAAVAPRAAVRSLQSLPSLAVVTRKILRWAGVAEYLVVEGIGGVLVPLGRDFSVLDLIKKLNARVVLVARDRVGVINHVRLSVAALQGARIEGINVVLMQQKYPDSSARGNAGILSEIIPSISLTEFPFLGDRGSLEGRLKRNSKKMQKSLAQMLGDE